MNMIENGISHGGIFAATRNLPPFQRHKDLAFLQFWREPVKVAGVEYFADGSESSFNDARMKWQLLPHLELITTRIHEMEFGRAIFLATLCSFFDDEAGMQLFNELQINPVSAACYLGDAERKLIGNLYVNYPGWEKIDFSLFPRRSPDSSSSLGESDA